MSKSPIKAMSEKRARDTSRMKLMRVLLWLPTYLILVPILRLIDWLGYGGRLQRRLNAQMKGKFQIEKTFQGFEPTEHDVIVSCFVKSGTNWTMQITHQIANEGRGEYDHIHDVIPWPDGMPGYAIDIGETAVWEAAPTKLRVIKSHLALDDIPYSEKAKYICVVRDPKDVAVSAYHFIRATTMGPLMTTMDGFLELYLSDDLLFGSWARQINSFWQMRDRPNVLFLTFRGMKENSRDAIEKIANLMDVSLDDEAFEHVVEKSAFAYMKSIDHKFFPGQLTPWSDPNGKMMRKGKIGDAGSLLSPAQQAQIDAHFRQQLLEMGSDFPYDELYQPAEFSANLA